jgi:hypothetical protein
MDYSLADMFRSISNAPPPSGEPVVPEGKSRLENIERHQT